MCACAVTCGAASNSDEHETHFPPAFPVMSQLALQFRLAGIPVRVEPGFWLIALLLGMSGSAKTIVLWMAVVFLSVLIHELGHALMARAFGASPEVTLYMMGGLTRSVYPSGHIHSRFRSALVTLAGPFAGFVLAGLTFVLLLLVQPREGTPALTVGLMLLWINLGWGMVNLLPVLPLDGGNLLREVLSGPGPEVGWVRALWVSVIVGPLVALASWKADMTWAAVLFAFFSYSAGKQLVQLSGIRKDFGRGLDARLEQAQQALVEGQFEKALSLASEVAEQARTKELREHAIHLAVMAQLELGEAQQALDRLERLSPDRADPFLYGLCLLSVDRPQEAVASLQRAVETKAHPKAKHVLVEALQRAGEQAAADELRKQLEI